MLEVNSVNKSYGKRRVLEDFSMSAEQGEILSLIHI